MPLDGECFVFGGPRQALCRLLLGDARWAFRAAGIQDPDSGRLGRRADLRRVSVRSHYSTIQSLEQYLKPADINLSYADGLLFKRMELLYDRKIPVASLFSGPYYFMEQLGFRKVIDSTFMIASMVTREPDPEDVRRYFRAFRRAQHDIDLRPELYTHYYKKEFPARFHEAMDTRRWGPASGWCLSHTRRKCSSSRFNGSPVTGFSKRERWDRASTKSQ